MSPGDAPAATGEVRGASGRFPGLFPKEFTAALAFLAATAAILASVLGPLLLGVIKYPTSPSAIWQIEAQDLVDLLIVAPLFLAGGILVLARHEAAKYCLAIPTLTSVYTGLTYGVGEEWGNPLYTGNSYQFAPLFLAMVVSGVLLLIASLSMFDRRSAVRLTPRAVRWVAYVLVPGLFLFALLWIRQIYEVMATGTLADGSYGSAPTAFWMVRYLDLCVTIPLGFLTPYLLRRHPVGGYPLAVLFAGYFVTLGTAVVAMGAILALHGDPSVQGSNAVQLVLFPILAALSYSVLYLLLRPQVDAWRAGRAAAPSPAREVGPHVRGTSPGDR